MKVQVKTEFWKGIEKEKRKKIETIIWALTIPNMIMMVDGIISGRIGIIAVSAPFLLFTMIMLISKNRYEVEVYGKEQESVQSSNR